MKLDPPIPQWGPFAVRGWCEPRLGAAGRVGANRSPARRHPQCEEGGAKSPDNDIV